MKLAAFDIDGTLIPLQTHHLDEKTVDAIQKLKKKHIYTVIATGRQYMTVHPEIRELCFDYYLCANGSCINDSLGKTIVKSEISKEEVSSLTKDFIELGCPIMFRYEEGGVDANPDVCVGTFSKIFWPAEMQKTEVKPARAKIAEGELPFGAMCHIETQHKPYLEKRHPGLDFTITGNGATCDITVKGTDKGTALKKLAAYLDVSIEECIAFGDDNNDELLLKAAGVAVAMGNAPEHLKQIADHVTADSADLGVVKGLRHYGLI